MQQVPNEVLVEANVDFEQVSKSFLGGRGIGTDLEHEAAADKVATKHGVNWRWSTWGGIEFF